MTVEFISNQVTKIEHNKCKKGILFAEEEIIHPKRTLCTTVKVINSKNKRLPVRTNGLIPKENIFEAMKEINKIKIDKNITIGEVIIDDLLGLGVSVVSSQSLEIIKECNQ